MSWRQIPDNPNWFFDDTEGVRTRKDRQIFNKVRRKGDPDTANRGEISATYWNAKVGVLGVQSSAYYNTLPLIGPSPAPTYSVIAPASIDEGSAGAVSVTTTNVSDSATLYWTVTPSGDFGTSSGSFLVYFDSASFNLTPTADLTTEGSEIGTIQIRTDSADGTIVATDTFTINDTSLTPYAISNSWSFDGDPEKMERTPGDTPTDADKWTFSGWIYPTDLTANSMILTAGLDVDDYDYIQISSAGALRYYSGLGGGTASYVHTADGAITINNWYHIVVSVDLDASSADRVKLYINGVLQSVTVATAATQTLINKGTSSYPQAIGSRVRPPSTYDSYFYGKMTEFHFVDGQVLTASDFGETDGSWTYKEYAGSYGANGFFVLRDADAPATDQSGLGNDFTTANITADDRTTDVPS